MALTDLGVVCPVPRGAYSAATEYYKLDIVTNLGSSYISKDTTTGVSLTDTDHWLLLVTGNASPNPNLLHNWDFRFNPINQRGANGDIVTGYFYDRWLRYAGTITIAATYLSLPADASIEQRIEGNALSGAVVDVSVMIGNAAISGTGTFPTSAGTVSVALTGFGAATLGYATGYMYVRFTAAISTRQVQAVKIELGAVSTLAYDPPMEYGLELAKCQRYFQLASGFVWNVAYSTTDLEFELTNPKMMRIVPTIVTTPDLGYGVLWPGQSWYTPTSITAGYEATSGMFYVMCYGTWTASRFYAFNAAKIVYFTADL